MTTPMFQQMVGDHTDGRMNLPMQVDFQYRLRFTRDAFELSNRTLAETMETQDGYQHRVLAFIDADFARYHSTIESDIEKYIASCGPRLRFTQAVRVDGGERCKNDVQYVENLLRSIHAAKICRHSYIIVIGGGALLDAVGFAASIAHRGIRLIRCPTTSLAQGDSGVGVKNGINAFGKKNYLGVFTPPWAVINDARFLTTLSDRDWRAGFAEAVKVSLVKSADFFNSIRQAAPSIRAREYDAAVPILNQAAQWHLSHILNGGDPYELTRARPLDYGHWSAHKLEHLTGYRLRHGEAVALGVSLDTVYSALTRSLSMADAEVVLECFETIGLATYDSGMDDLQPLLAGLDEFREHLGGGLTVTLLDGLGRASDVHEFDYAAVGKACRYLAERQSRRRSEAN